MHSQSITNLIKWLVLSSGLILMFVVVAPFIVLADGPLHDKDELKDETTPMPLYVLNQLVVKFVQSVGVSSKSNAGLTGGTVAYQLSSGAFLIQFEPLTDIESEVLSLSQLAGVEYVHPNYLLNPLHAVQGSLPFADQIGTGDYRNQPPSAMLNVNEAHLLATGAGVTIGLVDGGVDYTHDSLSGHIVNAYDFVDDDDDPFDESGGRASGHGTFVAGIIQLVAPDATIRAYRIFSPSGYGDGFTLARAIEQAVLDGCDVINISVALAREHQAVNDAIDMAIDQGIVVVAAAGNEGTSEQVFPAAYPPVIAVGAIDTARVFSEFSTYGPHIDICAPGQDIYSTFQDNGFAWWSGTSFAAPFVTAQVALLKQRRAGATHAEVAHVVIQTGSSLDITNPDRIGEIGAGIIDLSASIAFIDTLPTASVIPDTLFFEAVAGRVYFAAFFANVALSSSNSPAAYTVEVLPGDSLFAQAAFTTGMTNNDSLIILANPVFREVGLYYNTVLFHVDGVVEPVRLTVVMNVKLPENQVWLSPNWINVQAQFGTEPVIQRKISVSSLNFPANYSVIIPPSLSGLLQSDKSVGMTNDTVTFTIFPGNALSSGFFHDTVLFSVDGITLPGVLPVSIDIVDTAVTPGASITPSTMFFVDSSSPVGVLNQTALLTSINAPSPYSILVNVRAQQYLQVHSSDSLSGGVTDDQIDVIIVKSFLPGPGIYEDTVRFFVSGIIEPAVLLVTTQVGDGGGGGGDDSAFVTPRSLAFSAPEGADSIQFGSFYVGTPSTGSVPYVVTVIGGSDFVYIPDSNGMSNDSLVFEVRSNASMVAGLYADTLIFFIDGVPNPIISIVYISIVTDSGGGGLVSATVAPAAQAFAAVEGMTTVLSGSLFVSSPNAPAAFTVSLIDSASTFTTLITTSGMTNDAILFEINVPANMPAGIYVDTVHITVEGAIVNAGINPIIILQVDSTGGGVLPIATVAPSNQQFTIVENSGESLSGSVIISSTNAPAAYTVTLLDSSAAFTSLITTAGMTHDSILFNVRGTGLQVGTYSDTLLITVEGVDNNPNIAVLNLKIVASGVGGSDSAWVSPFWLTLDAVAGDTTPLTSCAVVQSSNAPALYSATLISSSGTGYLSFTATGLTGDSLCVSADPTGLAPGVYVDTITIDVIGVSNQTTLIFQFNIAQSLVRIALMNFPNPFNPSTQIQFTLPKLQAVRLSVFNILGQEVVRLIDETFPAGNHTVTWNGAGMSSGVYFYRLTTESEAITRKMLLLK